jgi:hypothetical protein
MFPLPFKTPNQAKKPSFKTKPVFCKMLLILITVQKAIYEFIFPRQRRGKIKHEL